MSVIDPPDGLKEIDVEIEDGLSGLVRKRTPCADCDPVIPVEDCSALAGRAFATGSVSPESLA